MACSDIEIILENGGIYDYRPKLGPDIPSLRWNMRRIADADIQLCRRDEIVNKLSLGYCVDISPTYTVNDGRQKLFGNIAARKT